MSCNVYITQNRINTSDVVKLYFSFDTFFLSCWKFQNHYFYPVKLLILFLTTITKEPNYRYLSHSGISSATVFFPSPTFLTLEWLFAFYYSPQLL